MHSLKAAPLLLIPPGIITMSPPPFTAPVRELSVHVALYSALSASPSGAVSLAYCYASFSALGPCSCIAYVPCIRAIYCTHMAEVFYALWLSSLLNFFPGRDLHVALV